jgi:glycosyltransferase involved in cell wall biosynthesis
MPLNYGYIPFQKLIISSVRHIVCVSAHGVKYLRSKYERFPGEIVLQRLGTTDFGQSSWESAPDFRIVSCSTVDENKQVLRLAGVIDKLNLPIEWTHIGDGPLMAMLKARVQLYNKDHIRVNLTGRLSNREVHEVYQSRRFDVFINISKSEGVPFSIMEALSHAIPVMATAVGGTPEIVDTSCGILLPDHIEDTELIRQLKYFIAEMVPRMKELREGARRRWEEKCNADVNCRQFTRFLLNDA